MLNSPQWYRICGSIEAHSSDIRCVRSLPDAQQSIFFTGGRDGLVCKWVLNPETLELTSDCIVTEHLNRYINAVAVIDDGQEHSQTIVVIGGNENTVEGYGPKCEKVFTLEDQKDTICHLNYSSGTKLLTSCSYDQSLCIYDATDRRNPRLLEKFSYNDDCVWCSEFVGNVLLGGTSNGSIGIWRLSDEHHISFDQFLCSIHSDCVRAICVLNDKQRAATASNDKTIVILNLESLAVVHRLEGHEHNIFDLIAIHDDSGESLVSAGEDHTLRIWSTELGKEKQIVHLPVTTCWSLAFSRSILMAACSDGILRIIAERKPESPDLDNEFLSFVMNAPRFDRKGMHDRPIGRGRLQGDYQYVMELNRDAPLTIAQIRRDDYWSRVCIFLKYEWKNDQWRRVGRCVKSKELLDEAFVSVDTECSDQLHRLRFKKDEDPHEVANRFLTENELPLNCTSQIVEFVQKQWPQHMTSIVPSMTYLSFTSMEVWREIERLRVDTKQPNVPTDAFMTTRELDQLDKDLEKMRDQMNWKPQDVNKILDRLMFICKRFPVEYVYPAMDVIRWILVCAPFDVRYWDRFCDLNQTLKARYLNENVLNGIVFLRIICNMFLTPNGIDIFVEHADSILDVAYNIYDDCIDDIRMINTFISVFYNYCLFHYKTGNGGKRLRLFIEKVDIGDVRTWKMLSIILYIKGYATVLLAPYESIGLTKEPLLKLCSSILEAREWEKGLDDVPHHLGVLKKTLCAVLEKFL